MELQHEAPTSEAVRRIPGKRAFSSSSESSRDKRAMEIHEVLTACVKDTALQKSRLLAELLAPPRASYSSAQGSELSIADVDRISRVPDDSGSTHSVRAPDSMSLNSNLLLRHNSHVEQGADSYPQSEASASEPFRDRGVRDASTSRITGAGQSVEAHGLRGPIIPSSWPHRTEASETVVQGENAVTLLQHSQAMTGLLVKLREQMVLQERKLATSEAENAVLRAENDALLSRLASSLDERKSGSSTPV